MKESKPIEERARDVAHSVNPHSSHPQDEFGWGYYRALKDGYIIGAHQQRTIDIDKACGALDDVYFPSEESREKAKQIVRKAMMEE